MNGIFSAAIIMKIENYPRASNIHFNGCSIRRSLVPTMWGILVRAKFATKQHNKTKIVQFAEIPYMARYLFRVILVAFFNITFRNKSKIRRNVRRIISKVRREWCRNIAMAILSYLHARLNVFRRLTLFRLRVEVVC